MIYDAVVNGALRIVDANGRDVAVTAPNQVNLTSTGLTLTRPSAPCPRCGATDDPHVCGDTSAAPQVGAVSGEIKHPHAAAVSLSGEDKGDQSATVRATASCRSL